MIEPFGFNVIDAAQEIYEQQSQVRRIIGETIDLPAFKRPPCR
jgi:hypothetical protein